MRKIQSVTTPFWRDKRIIPIIVQAVFAIVVLSSIGFLFSNAISGLNRIGISLGFDFLSSTASFSIGDHYIDYSPQDSYARALLVGISNTFKIAVIGIILATIIGVIVGIARLSNNWLASKLASLYVDIIRNTPVLVQIFIWYFAVFLTLPRIEEATRFAGMYFTNRGTVIPWFTSIPGTTTWIILFVIGIIFSIILWKVRLNKQVESGTRKYPALWACGSLIIAFLTAWIITGSAPFQFSVPTVDGKQFIGGLRVTPEFAAILIGLVVYTSSYIAEIVRAGISAVAKGQIEASKALGLKSGTTLRLVIFPQAIRIIIPPLTSQYLNLVKNSSLAVAVGYPDIVGVGNIIMSQTGRAIELVTIMILVYLSFSIITSILMNIFNKSTQLVER